MSDASCTWTIDADSFGECEAWRTDCDNRFVLIDGTPSENGFRFCPYCGRALVEAWPDLPVDDPPGK